MCIKLDLKKLCRYYKNFHVLIFEKIISEFSGNFIKIEKNAEKFKVIFFQKLRQIFFYKFVCVSRLIYRSCIELTKNIHLPLFEKIDSEFSGIFNKNQEK